MNRSHRTALPFWQATLSTVAIGALFLSSSMAAATDERGIAISGASTTEAAPVAVQPGFALLVGAAHYSSSRWPTLTTVPDELKLVGDALRRQGFQVRTETDLPSGRLIEVVRDFIANHGSDRSNRLVFYFSGHGYSRDDGNRGYFVPVDSPYPKEDETGFLRKAVDMNQVVSWARQVEANHALFVFDSCFSGTLFLQRGSGDSRLIQRLSAAPVREFITAGSAGETVPARSDFALAFAQALNDGLADANQDGYTTGTELGIYLQSHIGALGRQTPWYGKIPDFALAQGDFIFRSGRPQQKDPARPRPASLTVVSTPDGASVYVDGQLAGITPVTLTNLSAGRRRLEVRAEGYETERSSIDLRNGDVRQFLADLRQIHRLARLEIATSPGDAHITFRDSGQRYQPGMELPSGDYKIRVSSPGYRSRDLTVNMGNSDLRLVVDLAPAPEQIAQREGPDSLVASRPRLPPGYASPPHNPTCFSHNNLGAAFWWTAPNPYVARDQAIRVCQINTPPGAFCSLTHCN